MFQFCSPQSANTSGLAFEKVTKILKYEHILSTQAPI